MPDNLDDLGDIEWEYDPSDLLGMSDPYLPGGVSYVEFLVFSYRLSALVWLHRTISNAVAADVAELEERLRSGEGIVSGWETESREYLSESIGVLSADTAQVGAGAIILSCCSAIENLVTTILPSSISDKQRGLVRRVRALVALWPHREQADVILEDVEWLAKRRNSFAHRLIDEGGPWDNDRDGTAYSFGDDEVEEAFVRAGAIATTLERGYGEYIRQRRSSC